MAIKIEKRFPDPKKSTTKMVGECFRCRIKFSCTGADVSREDFSYDGRVIYCSCPECGEKVSMHAWFVKYIAFFILAVILFIIIFPVIFTVVNKG